MVDPQAACDRDSLVARLLDFSDPGADEQQIASRFRATKGHAAHVLARRASIDRENLHEFIRPFQPFPFDYRWAYLRKDLLVGHRFDVMLNLADGKPGLVTTRQTKEAFGVFAVTGFCGHKILGSYDKSYVFPLFHLSELTESVFVDFSTVAELATGTQDDIEPLDVFNYMYAVLHSPYYRRRYSEYLRIDFPRLPLTSQVDLFRDLSDLGGQLVGLHVMDSPRLADRLTTSVGDDFPRVSRVSYRDGTVWLDDNLNNGIQGVPADAWVFHVGGYQVCEKWLKDRGPRRGQPGRTLTIEDMDHYHRMVTAVAETVRLMRRIDDVIDTHGGWPAAFVAAGSEGSIRSSAGS